jgi:hypothetical protein
MQITLSQLEPYDGEAWESNVDIKMRTQEGLVWELRIVYHQGLLKFSLAKAWP